MAFPTRRFVWMGLIAALVVLGSFAFGLFPLNLFFLKNTISEVVQEKTGLELDIRGPLRVRLGARPTITASDLRLGDPGSNAPTLLHADRLNLRTELLSLVHRELDIRQLEITALKPDYCVLADCALSFLPPALRIVASAPSDDHTRLNISSDNSEHEFELIALGGPLSELLGGSPEYPLELELSLPGARLAADGQVLQPFESPRIAVQLSIHTDETFDMRDALGLELPLGGKLSVSTDILADANEVKLDSFDGSLAGHRVRLSGRLSGFDSRPVLELDASLDRLDLEKISRPGGEEGEPWDGDLSAVSEIVSGFDADIRLRAGSITGAPIELSEWLLKAKLRHGRLSLGPVKGFAAGATVDATAHLDFNKPCPALETEVRLYELQLTHLKPLFGNDALPDGNFQHLSIRSGSCGSNLGNHLSSLDLALASGPGELVFDADDRVIELENAHARTSWVNSGTLNFSVRLGDTPLDTEIVFPALSTVIAGEPGDYSLQAQGNETVLDFNGQAVLDPERYALDGQLTITADRFGALHPWLGSPLDNNLPVHAGAELHLSDESLDITDLEIKIDRSDVRGRVILHFSDPEKPHEFYLQSRYLDMLQLSELYPENTPGPEEQDAPARQPILNSWKILPSADVAIEIQEMIGTNFHYSTVNMNAQLRDRQIRAGHLSLNLGGTPISGNMDADFSEVPGKFLYHFEVMDADVGLFLASLDLVDGVDLTAAELEMNYESSGNSLRQLMENASADIFIRELEWQFTAGPENLSHTVLVDQLELMVARGQPALWNVTGSLNHLPLRVFVETPSLRKTFDRSQDLPIRLVLATGKDIVLMKARFIHRKDENLQLELAISGNTSSPESAVLSAIDSPLDYYHISSLLTIEENRLLLDDFNARIVNSTAHGRIEALYQDGRYYLETDLQSPRFETADITQWLEDWRIAYRQYKHLRDSQETIVQGDVEAPISEAAGGFFQLASQQLGPIIDSFDFDILLQAEELTSDGFELGRSRLEVVSENNDLRVDLDIEGVDSYMTANYDASEHDEAFHHRLDLHAEDLRFGGLLRLFNPDAEANGTLYLDTSLQSEATDVEQVIANLHGNLDFVAYPEEISADFLDLWASNLIFALLDSEGDSDKKMNCMVGRFKVKDGIMKSKDTFLDSTDTIVRARGNIDLVGRELDLYIAPQSKTARFLSISTPLEVTGPFEDFEVNVVPGGILTTAIRLYLDLIYVPLKWLTGERFPKDGIETCHRAMNWEQQAPRTRRGSG